MPGRPASIWGRGAEGLPTIPALSLSTFFSVMMSRPQKVKNTIASMPIIRAALARISPGYAMSRLPLEQMMATLRGMPWSFPFPSVIS